MRKRPSKSCYFCGEPATSSEHVPPRCLFPERKDVPESDHRRNLITVPSCDLHNSRKSKDDEFLMACLAPLVGNNATAFAQTQTKLFRLFDQKPHILGEVLREPYRITVKSTDKEFPLFVGKPHVERLCKALEAVARGIYFHAHNRPFDGDVFVLPTFVLQPPATEIGILQLLAGRMVAQESLDWPVQGENPDVFTYRFGSVDQHGLVPLALLFYGRADVLVAFRPTGVGLPHRILSDATPENPIDVEIALGEGASKRCVTWRITGA